MIGIVAVDAALILAIPLALLVLSVFLLTRARIWGLASEARIEIGSSLLTGSLVAFAVFALQLYLDDKRDEEIREEQFRLTLGVTRDLEGLDPPLPLAGMHLSGKILDNAELAGEDLSGANLQEASLRGANLEGANLQGTSLFDADLTGATLSRANLRNADLRFARMGETRIYALGESTPSLKLHGAQVNAATCWPEDFMVSDLTEELRAQLEPLPTEVHGQLKADPAIGHACVLTLNNIVDNLGQYPERGRNVEQLADPYGVDPDRVFALFERERAPRARATRPVTIDTDPCVGSRRVKLHQTQWLDGPTLLIVREPEVNVSEARVFALSGRRPNVGLGQPLRRGMKVTAFTQKSVKVNARTYAVSARVRTCRGAPGRGSGREET
jgi:Pentapeptide repeats (8 copies)